MNNRDLEKLVDMIKIMVTNIEGLTLLNNVGNYNRI
jgi:3-deoxy-D-arabino-heptulosonate 7-phosphate (DAHP) synthase